MKLRTFVAASRRPGGRRLEFLHSARWDRASLPVISWGPPGHTPCPTTRFRRTGDVERKKSYTPSFQTLTSIYPCQAARKIRPLLLQCKQIVVREKHLGGTKINAIPPGQLGTTKGTMKWRKCWHPAWRALLDAPCRHSWRHIFAACLCSMVEGAGVAATPAALPALRHTNQTR